MNKSKLQNDMFDVINIQKIYLTLQKINFGEPFPDKKIKFHKIVNNCQITHC